MLKGYTPILLAMLLGAPALVAALDDEPPFVLRYRCFVGTTSADYVRSRGTSEGTITLQGDAPLYGSASSPIKLRFGGEEQSATLWISAETNAKSAKASTLCGATAVVSYLKNGSRLTILSFAAAHNGNAQLEDSVCGLDVEGSLEVGGYGLLPDGGDQQLSCVLTAAAPDNGDGSGGY